MCTSNDIHLKTSMQTIELRLSNPISMYRLRSDYYTNDAYRTDDFPLSYGNDSGYPITPAQHSTSSVNPNYGIIADASEITDSVFTEPTHDNNYIENN